MNEPMFERIFGQNRKPTAPQGVCLYAIGDIHGRADLLVRLLEKIAADKSESSKRLIFLGDYVDRGEHSREVLDRLIALKSKLPDTVFLKGNHEAAMLEFLEQPRVDDQWLDWGGAETMMSYGIENVWRRDGRTLSSEFAAVLPETHLQFLRGLDLSFDAGDYFFAHAGVRPGVPLNEQSAEDLMWIRGAFHDAPPSERPDKTIVHGHHPMKKPLDAGWRIAVDTGAVWSNVLTAVALEGTSRRFVQTD